MGIFDALTTAVAGLQAQSFALQNISGNIANSQTTAYKETDTSFQDLVSQAVVSQQTTNGVIANSVATNAVQGTIQSTSVSTDMAINGDGWFVVSKPSGFTDNLPVPASAISRTPVMAQALSNQTTSGTPVVAGRQAGFSVGISGMSAGNSLQLSYSDALDNGTR
jgi:flagellar basal body rod protein FlgF